MNGSLKHRLRSLITRECVAKGYYLKNINFGIMQAEELIDKGHNLASCTRLGVAVAESRQRRSNRKRRSAMNYVA